MFLFDSDPKIALTCCAAGIVGIFYELQRPGAVLPGILGLAAALAGAYGIWRQSSNRLGIALLALALLLFAIEAAWKRRFLAGALATGALAAGLKQLFAGPARIPSALAVSIAAALGSIIVWLLAVAKRARRNKFSDL